eukprot:TRINITY_DN55580_c0_g1_i1.p1 TRINITY_DN55580_c0_g1~~TRINITY_DN55580_c0_g1_i1.p1  ORF type:complete len:594 (-),score=23.10 TRINITY_DN55580_c0_g1_i1:313-2070(-)
MRQCSAVLLCLISLVACADIEKYNECIKFGEYKRGLEDGSEDVTVQLDGTCMIKVVGNHDILAAAIGKYTLLQHYLEQKKNIFFFDTSALLKGDPLPFVVGDADIEVVSNGCPDQTHREENYHFDQARDKHDTYSGYWHIEDVRMRGSRAWGCASAWFFVEAAFDPRLFYLRNTEYSLFWVKEMQQEMLRTAKLPHDEFSETHLFNKLLNRRFGKYMTVRRFPGDYFVTDTCAMRWAREGGGETLNAVGRLHDQFVSKEARAWFDSRVSSRHLVGVIPNLNHPEASASLNCNELKDPLCLALDHIAITHPNLPQDRVVGLVVIKGQYLKVNPIAKKMYRYGLEPHTICVCLDAAGCGECTRLNMTMYPADEFLSVPTLSGPYLRELYNMYKYQVAYEILKRGFSVLSYDLDILFLQPPWEYIKDPRFDIHVSTDGHTGYWSTESRTYDLWSYIRTSVNAGFWYARPTKTGKELFWRITAQHNATTTQGGVKVPYFFEQAQFATVLFQTRCIDKPYCWSDARWHILPPSVVANSKFAWGTEADHATLCNAMAIHSNYGCPGAQLAYDKYEWLLKMGETCGARILSG